MSFPKYAEYKDSGVEWLGKVPAKWNIKPLKFVADFINGDAFKPSDWADAGMPIIRIQNLNGSEDFNYYDGEVDERYLVRDNDLLFGWSGNRGTSFGPFIWRWKEVCVLNQHIFRVVPYAMEHSELYWVLKAVTAHVENQAHGIIGMVHITKSDLGAINIPVPSNAEQRAIAAFLDRETAKIDALVEEQRRLIKLLKEKRQAVISQAVTKGLDPNVPMKDSGVEWLGKVPAHWEVQSLKRHLAFLTSGSRGWAEHYSDDGALFIRIGNLTRDSIEVDLSDIQRVDVPVGSEGSRTRVMAGDLLLSITAYLGSVAVVPVDIEEAYVSQHVALARLRGDSLLSEWAAFVIKSCVGANFLALQGYGGTKVQLSLDDVAEIPMLVPKLEEQRALVNHIRVEVSKLELLMQEANRAIHFLQERRSALISAAVTGKIDVRGLVPQPEAVAA